MNIRCPECQTVFRVNPERIPATGARARCARCGATFMVKPPAPARAGVPPAAARPAPPPPSRPKPAAAPAATRAPEPAPARAPSVPAGVGSGRDNRNGSAPATRPAEPAHGSPLGARNPDARAERLARALVSDIVAYNPERRDKSLAEGTLRTEFRDEIMKSWEEYVAQVGDGVARSTPFFRDALNKILAQGQQVF